MKRYQATEVATGRTAKGSIGELHDTVTGWLLEGEVSTSGLRKVDELMEAVEHGHYSADLQAGLGIDIDVIYKETSR